MKKIFINLLLLFFMLLIAGGCQSKKELILKSPVESKVYSIKVGDATEVDLLRQQLHLDIITVENSVLYFHAESESILKQLTAMGYESPQTHVPDEVYSLYAKVTGKYNEEEIVRNGVAVINREKDYVIVYGRIKNLRTLKSAGYQLYVPESEVRPREIEVSVPSQPDIQKLYGWGVDIFTATKDSTGKNGFIIHGSAFDRQIDSMKKMNYPVKIIRQKI